MSYEGYACLSVRCEEGVASVTIDHPPINLLGPALIGDLMRLGGELAADDTVRVAVFQSANPEFFIAHADVAMIQQLPAEPRPKPVELEVFHAMVERFRNMPKATIGKIQGRARGGGSEFLLSLDMRFAARGETRLGQPEVALGIIPGGSGTQRLPRLMGRSRALEAILGCDDFDADTAERYGWVNRALDPDEIDAFVDRLARRIASFPAHAIALAKRAVDAAEGTTREGLLEEGHLFAHTLRDAGTRERMERFLAIGGQTREVELELGAVVERLGGDPD